MPFRKAYLRSLTDAVEVDQHVVRFTDQGRRWEGPYSPTKPPIRVFAALYGNGAAQPAREGKYNRQNELIAA